MAVNRLFLGLKTGQFHPLAGKSSLAILTSAILKFADVDGFIEVQPS